MIDEEKVRREKLEKIIKSKIDPYPAKVERTHLVAEVLDNFKKLEKQKAEITLAGRLRTIRGHGGLVFAHLEDASGKIQVVMKKDELGADKHKMFTNLIDPADFIEVKGKVFVTQKGEQSILANDFRIISKALLPLPEKWHGLQDIEKRYRQRYLDLIANPEVKEVFEKRAQIIEAIRQAFLDEDFLEVETPILQPIPGGATARPFITHHNTLDIDMYLRVAPELYLKRLIVGGYEKVFEIGRNFRNEGIDWQHNPEFTSCEFYWAYKDYQDVMDFTEKLISDVVKKVNGSMKVSFRDAEIDFTPPWPRKKFKDAIMDEIGLDIDKMSDKDLVKEMKKLNIESDYKASRGKLLDDLYKDVVRAKIIQPTIIYDYPIEMEPLAKKCKDNPKYVQRFQPIVYGMELVKAYSELNDPDDQLARFEEQQKLREKGDEEAQMIDMDFVTALRHAMPPTTGWGMGIDRFVAILTNQLNLKDVILFPTLKPEKDE
ncbi:lysine--tRNA ligase [Candidatus Saccharibacteria bacterium]|nr:lysine--tRNA ligase [Candidatus Saccharibacteria bacterium]NIV03347.1 lysine--tRNA ligase [Calditrichia bacterium]NIS37892.1 lysine--tRNA ligase [Candidatus Saccharibacteria bacterium]NIV71555.1 lysine--tRNA ligase [Calditrichia bacterium]NIV98142.1 lysine--tRNA ligase [Candidatus Saccharibacteria bacterium]